MNFQNRVVPPRSSEERAAIKEQKREEAEQAMKERREADDAFQANFQRLKAERLARERKSSRAQ